MISGDAERFEKLAHDLVEHHYVSHEDLITLELERISRDDNLDFNNCAAPPAPLCISPSPHDATGR